MSADTAALLPCPFCGATDAVRLDDGDSWDFLPDGEPVTWAVVCDYNRGGCGGSGGFRDSQKDAIAAWNQAADRLSALEEENGRLKEVLGTTVDALESAMSMMEPYYSQSGARRELDEIAEAARLLLPYSHTYEAVVPPCPECGKQFHHRDASNALNMHLCNTHQWSLARRKKLFADIAPRTVEYKTKAEFLAAGGDQ